ncbi:replication protein [Sodalis ligni]|uniref:replication protein P n=1 Tax=Sodalis ligni TaxID=2697027 RepID=UPI00193F5670|nr:replication protein P [Sodalis ligni]QWA09552.1 replication protein [Sodalis ligni]
MVEIYSDRWISKNGAIPTSTWAATIGHLTENEIGQVVQACLEKCAAGNTWPPDLAEFVSLVAATGANPLGLTVYGILSEHKKWVKESYRYGGADEYPWRHPVLYHICIEMQRAGRRMTEGELERLAEKLLTKWIKHIKNGLSVPPIRRQIAPPRHPEGPTPAQLLYAEYLRRKAAGLCK